MTGKEIVWGLVVEGDEIYSDKTKKWYPVTGSVSLKGGQDVKIFARGLPRAIVKPAGGRVLVRRGSTGDAVDVIQLIFSGQVAPEER